MTLNMRAIVELNVLRSGNGQLIIQHPVTHLPMMMFLLSPGNLPLAKRAIEAYHNGDGDADAFFVACGMSDTEAFNRNTWS